MDTKRKRNVITAERRVEVIDYHEKHLSMGHTAVAAHFEISQQTLDDSDQLYMKMLMSP